VCRTTNLLERLFVEERRRSRAAGTVLAGERAVMKLMFAALIRASENWRGIRISQFERHQLERLQEQLNKGFKERQEPVVKESSAPIPIYSSHRT
jgi:transposase-like protein